MSKYEKSFGLPQMPLENVIAEGESVIWSARPKKSAFVVNKALTMLPVALIWLLFDGGIIIMMATTGAFAVMGSALFFVIPFFVLHLIPVWIWLANILTANKKWKNTQYALTDKRIIIQTGFIGMEYSTIYYKEITDVQLKVGVVDKMLGVGDIYFKLASNKSEVFLDVENPYEIYSRVQKIVLDIQTDIHYPNNLRPNENSGYNTKYNG